MTEYTVAEYPVCRDCAYCVNNHECYAPQAFDSFDFSKGVKSRSYITCNALRNTVSPNSCGISAKWFKPKEIWQTDEVEPEIDHAGIFFAALAQTAGLIIFIVISLMLYAAVKAHIG